MTLYNPTFKNIVRAVLSEIFNIFVMFFRNFSELVSKTEVAPGVE